MTQPAPNAVIPGRSARKRQAILEAATEAFLQGGYSGTNMDEVAASAGVSKQTVYKHFSSKEALFIEIASGMSTQAGDTVQQAAPTFSSGDDVEAYLLAYGRLQLEVVLQPRLMQLRRLVIGEVHRFPELGKALYDNGPGRAMAMLSAMFRDLAARGLLAIPDPTLAASQFNWLLMSAPLNLVMLLGDDAIPEAEELHRHAAQSARMFLAAYGRG